MGMENENDYLLPRESGDGYSKSWRSRTSGFLSEDVYETETDIRAEFELPGLERDDIIIDVTDRGLRVRIRKRATYEGDDDRMFLIEGCYSGFERFIALPPSAELDKVHARYDRGILHIDVPKRGPRHRLVHVE